MTSHRTLRDLDPIKPVGLFLGHSRSAHHELVRPRSIRRRPPLDNVGLQALFCGREPAATPPSTAAEASSLVAPFDERLRNRFDSRLGVCAGPAAAAALFESLHAGGQPSVADLDYCVAACEVRPVSQSVSQSVSPSASQLASQLVS